MRLASPICRLLTELDYDIGSFEWAYPAEEAEEETREASANSKTTRESEKSSGRDTAIGYALAAKRTGSEILRSPFGCQKGGRRRKLCFRAGFIAQNRSGQCRRQYGCFFAWCNFQFFAGALRLQPRSGRKRACVCTGRRERAARNLLLRRAGRRPSTHQTERRLLRKPTASASGSRFVDKRGRPAIEGVSDISRYGGRERRGKSMPSSLLSCRYTAGRKGRATDTLLNYTWRRCGRRKGTPCCVPTFGAARGTETRLPSPIGATWAAAISTTS